MTRDDLLKINANIVQKVCEETIKQSPEAIYIVVTNPLDVMTYLAWQTTKLPTSRVMGMAGVLDSARFQAFISMELNVSCEDVRTMVLGGHGDLMVPLPRYSTVNGIPIPELMPKDRVDALCQRTRDGGAEIVGLLKTGSAFYAPGASVTTMVDAILRNKNRLLPCAVHADGMYGINDIYVGLPAVLGKNGVEKVLELKLAKDELDALQKSAASIKDNINVMKQLLVAV
jgi:malate dehydrogenase